MESTIDPKFKIAYWLTDKKKSKLKINQIEQLLNKDGYHLIRIKKPEDFKTKGPFAVFFHKLTDITINLNINENHNNNLDNADKWLQSYKDYINKYPWTRVLDPLTKIENLLDRNRQYKLAVEKTNDSYSIPNFIELKTKNKEENIRLLNENNVQFPLICKPIIAHGCSLAHQMSLVFSEDGLDDIRVPCVAQTFINHSAKLYKLFVLKNQYSIVERPSLKNHKPGNFPTVHFDSHQISKMDSACDLNKMTKEDQLRLNNRVLNKEKLDRIVNSLRDCFKLTFFGVDVIVEDETFKYVIIDVNCFPAYDGVENFTNLFKDVLIEEAKIAITLRKEDSKNEESLTDQTAESTLNYTSTNHQVANTIYSRIVQWFMTLNKKVG